MFEEIIEEGKDFFEDIFEHLFERKENIKSKDSPSVIERTKLAYQFSERIDSMMKIVFGGSILISGVVASVWGFASVGDLVKTFVSSWPGRFVLLIIGISYLINGFWRFFHTKH